MEIEEVKLILIGAGYTVVEHKEFLLVDLEAGGLCQIEEKTQQPDYEFIIRSNLEPCSTPFMVEPPKNKPWYQKFNKQKY